MAEKQEEVVQRRERCASVRRPILEETRGAKHFKKEGEAPSTLETISENVNSKENKPKYSRPTVSKAKAIPKPEMPQEMLAAFASKRSRIAPVSQQIMPSHLSNKPKISAAAKPKMTNNPTNTDKNGNSKMPMLPTGRISKHRSMPDLNW